MLMVQRCVDDLSWEIMNGWWLIDMATMPQRCIACIAAAKLGEFAPKSKPMKLYKIF